MSKKDDLARDLALLFVKYDQKTWSGLLKALSADEFAPNKIGAHIEKLTRTATRRRQSAKKTRSIGIRKELEGLEPEKARPLLRLYQGLFDKELFPKMPQLRNFAFNLGLKEPLPEKRDQALRVILRHLAGFEVDAIRKSLESEIKRQPDYEEEYASWFKIIYGRTS